MESLLFVAKPKNFQTFNEHFIKIRKHNIGIKDTNDDDNDDESDLEGE